jgi:flavorubredoxin
MITNRQSGTTIEEIAPDIYRISTPVTVMVGGFTFNQYLIVDEAPLLFHTGLRRLFPLTREAIAAVMPIERLRYISFSHYEADECGALNEFLAAAPEAAPLCGDLVANVSIGDVADRPPQPLADGEAVSLGRHRVRWFATPHLPHAWECGFLFEETTKTLLCGDLFTQGGAQHPAVTEADILEPSERFRAGHDYYSHTKNAPALIDRLAAATINAADDARLHARTRLARRWRGLAARAGRASRALVALQKSPGRKPWH